MTLEQSMVGKHISGYMFPLCLETQFQIKVKTTVPPGAIALENKAGLLDTSWVAIHIQVIQRQTCFKRGESSKFSRNFQAMFSPKLRNSRSNEYLKLLGKNQN